MHHPTTLRQINERLVAEAEAKAQAQAARATMRDRFREEFPDAEPGQTLAEIAQAPVATEHFLRFSLDAESREALIGTPLDAEFETVGALLQEIYINGAVYGERFPPEQARNLTHIASGFQLVVKEVFRRTRSEEEVTEHTVT